VNTALNTSGDPLNNSWTGGFTYDNNGNVLTTTDAKGTTITSTYDALNRPLTRTYNDSPQTATVTNTYGTTAPAIGKLIKVSSSVSETQYSGFNVLGRLTESKQITPLDGETLSTAPVRTSSYQYNLSGALIQQTYPSGRVVETDLDASGDIANVTSKKNSSAIFGTFANNFSYTAAGAISSMRLGNGKWENTKYNTRLQPIEMGLGASSTDAGAWKVAYEYGELQTNGTVDVTKNSGNIGKQTLTVPGTSFVTAYKYDPLNRLTEAQEKTGSTQNWIQTFGYDVFGNRTSFSQTIGSTTTSTTPTVNASTNRFNTGQGFAYDANGNVTQDFDAISSHTRSFTFNGDNKQTQVKDVTNSNHVVGTYYYDGEGKRVKKVTDTETTVFVYALGRIVAEYSTQISSTPSVAYTTADHLGSPRVITNEQAQVESRRDFMPFGEELYTGVGGRSSSINYGSSADDVRQKFTGYQKDSETNLDFAEARIYENRYGRFTAVDPLVASGQTANPQTFNRYIYVNNSPLVRIDPTGMIGDYFDSSGKWLCHDGKNDDKVYFAKLAENRGAQVDIYADSIKETTLDAVLKAQGNGTQDINPIQAFAGAAADTANDAIVGLRNGAVNTVTGAFNNNPITQATGVGLPTLQAENAKQAAYATAVPIGVAVGSGVAGAAVAPAPSAVPVSRVFWTGGAKTEAASFAAANNMKALEMTIPGKIMDKVGPSLPKSVSTTIWRGLSSNFARGTTGDAHLFVGPRGVSPNSFWIRTERPILQSNGIKIIEH